MWTPTTRRQHSRDGLRYETDLTDAEWALIEPLMPGRAPRAAAGVAAARDPQRDLLRAARRDRLAAAAERPAAAEHGLRLVRLWRDTGLFETHQPPSRHGRPRAGRARGVAQRRRDRQPERQDDRERRARAATTPARRSRAASARSSSTPTGAAWSWSPSRPTFRTATARPVLRLSRRSFPFIAKAFADSGYAGERACERHRHRRRDRPQEPPTRSASPSIRGAGSSSASSPGSAATGGSGRTPKRPSPPPEPSSTPPPSCCLTRRLARSHEFPDRWGDWGLGLRVAAPFGMLERGPC